MGENDNIRNDFDEELADKVEAGEAAEFIGETVAKLVDTGVNQDLAIKAVAGWIDKHAESKATLEDLISTILIEDEDDEDAGGGPEKDDVDKD